MSLSIIKTNNISMSIFRAKYIARAFLEGREFYGCSCVPSLYNIRAFITLDEVMHVKTQRVLNRSRAHWQILFVCLKWTHHSVLNMSVHNIFLSTSRKVCLTSQCAKAFATCSTLLVRLCLGSNQWIRGTTVSGVTEFFKSPLLMRGDGNHV